MTPVVFGCPLKDFGVDSVIDLLANLAPPPRRQPAIPRDVEPGEKSVTGLVFKVQANMDPHHRDRVAFLRLCSGRFVRGMKMFQVRTRKSLAVQNPIFFFAQERTLADEAFPGDIIGISNHGTLRVGDSLTEGEVLTFTGLPSFAPEVLRRVRLGDPMRAKQLKTALEDLAEEGVTQILRPVSGGQWIVGVVGELQLDVLTSRIGIEYGIGVAFEPVPYEMARWVSGGAPALLRNFVDRNRASIAEDQSGGTVFMARNAWELNHAIEQWPTLTFGKTRERL